MPRRKGNTARQQQGDNLGEPTPRIPSDLPVGEPPILDFAERESTPLITNVTTAAEMTNPQVQLEMMRLQMIEREKEREFQRLENEREHQRKLELLERQMQFLRKEREPMRELEGMRRERKVSLRADDNVVEEDPAVVYSAKLGVLEMADSNVAGKGPIISYAKQTGNWEMAKDEGRTSRSASGQEGDSDPDEETGSGANSTEDESSDGEESADKGIQGWPPQRTQCATYGSWRQPSLPASFYEQREFGRIYERSQHVKRPREYQKGEKEPERQESRIMERESAGKEGRNLHEGRSLHDHRTELWSDNAGDQCGPYQDQLEENRSATTGRQDQGDKARQRPECKDNKLGSARKEGSGMVLENRVSQSEGDRKTSATRDDGKKYHLEWGASVYPGEQRRSEWHSHHLSLITKQQFDSVGLRERNLVQLKRIGAKVAGTSALDRKSVSPRDNPKRGTKRTGNSNGSMKEMKEERNGTNQSERSSPDKEEVSRSVDSQSNNRSSTVQDKRDSKSAKSPLVQEGVDDEADKGAKEAAKCCLSKENQDLLPKRDKAPTLYTPIIGHSYPLQRDVSEYAVAGCLPQPDDHGQERPIAFTRRKLAVPKVKGHWCRQEHVYEGSTMPNLKSVITELTALETVSSVWGGGVGTV